MSESSRRRPAARARFPARPEPAPPEPAPDLPLRRFVAETCLPRVAEKPARGRILPVAAARFDEFLAEVAGEAARPATIADLTSANLFEFCDWFLARKRRPATADSYRAALQIVGRIAAELGLLDAPPHIPKIDRPRPGGRPLPFPPPALEGLFGSARTMPGEVVGVPAGLWWLALLATSFDCELAGPTLLQLPATAFDREANTLAAAGVRYRLHPKTVALLTRLIDVASARPEAQSDGNPFTAGNQKLFPWDGDNGRPPYHALYHRVRELLARARLPRQTRLFDRLRASAAASADGLDAIDLAAEFHPHESPPGLRRRRGDRRAKGKGNRAGRRALAGGGAPGAKPRSRRAETLYWIQQPRGTRTVRTFFEEFYVPRRLAAKSPDTVIAYRSTVNALSRFVAAEVPLARLDDDLVERFLCWTAAARLSPSSRKRMRGEILAIWRYAWRKGLTETLPRDIEEIRVPKTVPDAWSITEIERLLAAAATLEGFFANIPARFYWPALISTIFDTGLRIAAVMRLRTADVDWEHGFLLARWETQKQKADQALPLSAETLRLLRATAPDQRDILFPGPFSGRYPRRGMAEWLRRILDRAGLPSGKRHLFHKLRRTNATYVADVAGEEAAMRQLGHSTISITRRYIDPRKLRAPRIIDGMQRPEFQHPDLIPTPAPAPARRPEQDREVVP